MVNAGRQRRRSGITVSHWALVVVANLDQTTSEDAEFIPTIFWVDSGPRWSGYSNPAFYVRLVKNFLIRLWEHQFPLKQVPESLRELKTIMDPQATLQYQSPNNTNNGTDCGVYGGMYNFRLAVTCTRGRLTPESTFAMPTADAKRARTAHSNFTRVGIVKARRSCLT